MATSQPGVLGMSVPLLVVVEYRRGLERVPTQYHRTEGKIVPSLELQWRQKTATPNLVQVSSCFSFVTFYRKTG